MVEAVILLLLQDMAKPSFKARETATFQLATLNYFWDSRVLIRKHGLSHKDPEVRRRTKSVLDDYESPLAGSYPRIESMGDCGNEVTYNKWLSTREAPPWNISWDYSKNEYWNDREDRVAAIYFTYDLIQTRSRWEVMRFLRRAEKYEIEFGIKVIEVPEGWEEPEIP